jgi:chemotaxis signal transduction protein
MKFKEVTISLGQKFKLAEWESGNIQNTITAELEEGEELADVIEEIKKILRIELEDFSQELWSDRFKALEELES